MGLFSLSGLVTIITGGGSGIGKAAAERFASAGAHVVIACRGDAGELAASIGATYVKTDVSVEGDVERLIEETFERFGRLDVLINNAGYFGRTVPIAERTREEMIQSFEVNLLSVFYGMKYAARRMTHGGSIINTTSLAAVIGFAEYGDYTASKFAAAGLIRSAAVEFGAKGIRVNEICPTSVNTPMLRDQDSADAEIQLTRTAAPLGNVIEPEEVAAIMHFLAARDCPNLTGQRIIIDGGMSCGFSPAIIDAAISVGA